MCFTDKDCAASKFCNFDYDNHGFCEYCRDKTDEEKCRSDGLPGKGEESCIRKCVNTNNETTILEHSDIYECPYPSQSYRLKSIIKFKILIFQIQF